MMNDSSEIRAMEHVARQAVVRSVMVLADNDERHIRTCLDSIFGADPGAPLEVYRMVNGCSDGTEDIVREWGKAKRHVHLVSIELGDKCNAWNVFVHETVAQECPGHEIYFFMDGDARVVAGSFSAMEKALRGAPAARAVGASPTHLRLARGLGQSPQRPSESFSSWHG